jgi:enolase-phosphatase E1
VIKAIVTDIEGTTSSINFVHQVLFPYAAKHIPDFIRANNTQTATRSVLNEVASLANLDAENIEALIEQLLTWIATDQKVTPLKTLQGLVWEHGYQNGDYKAHIYVDALEILQAWYEQGIPLYVYSSGSVHAQQLFFGFNEGGDLRYLFKNYFDTVTGAKREAASYQKIQASLGLAPSDILFISDIVEELDAAAEVGMKTVWVQRGSEDIISHSLHQVVSNFYPINLDC